MTSVHPAFDVETRTWFVRHPRRKTGYVEAPSIRELLAKLGTDYMAIGYTTECVPHPSALALGHVPYGQAAALLRPQSPALHSANPTGKTRTLPVFVDVAPPVAKTRTDEQRAKAAAYSRQYYHKRNPQIDISKPIRDALSAERARWTPLENMILDAWAAGETGPAIALRLRGRFPDNRPKITPAYVGANVVPQARLKGDPRAVVRNPHKYGKKWGGG